MICRRAGDRDVERGGAVKVYQFSVGEGVELVVTAPLQGPDLLGVAGTRQGVGWRPHPVELIREDEGRRLEPTDWPVLTSSLPVVKTAALPAVADELEPFAELLPLDCPQEPLTAVNVLAVADALNEQASDVARLPNGRIFRVRDHAFVPERLPDRGVFRIPQQKRVFCTERTAQVLQRRSPDLVLQVVWDSEASA